MPVTSTCPVCQREYRQNKGGSQLLCRSCNRSLKTSGCSLYDIIRWSARRAIRFERKRFRDMIRERNETYGTVYKKEPDAVE